MKVLPMKMCERCGENILGLASRVTSTLNTNEEIYLDWTVCYSCASYATRLTREHLIVEPLGLPDSDRLFPVYH